MCLLGDITTILFPGSVFNASSNKAYKKIEFDYERLTDKTQMGEIFKVLVISCI